MSNLNTSPVGTNLRTRREARGWSRDTLGKNAGVSEATIARIELYGASPKLSMLQALAVALECDAADLLSTPAADPEQVA